MMIDAVGGIRPSQQRPQNNASAVRYGSVSKSDSVEISAEGARKAEHSHVKDLVKSSESPERASKIQEVQRRLTDGVYDNLSREQTDKISESLMLMFYASGKSKS